MNHFGHEYFGYCRYETRKDILENPELQNIFRNKKPNKTIETVLLEAVAYIEKMLVELFNQINSLSENRDAADVQKIKELKEQFLKLKDNYRTIKDCMGAYDPEK